MKDNKINCPICNGSGKLTQGKTNNFTKGRLLFRERAVKLLHKDGYSYREIMKFVGYKSPRSINVILKKKSEK